MKVSWSNGKDKSPTVEEITFDAARKMFKVHSRSGGILLYSTIENLRNGVERHGRGKVLDGFDTVQ